MQVDESTTFVVGLAHCSRLKHSGEDQTRGPLRGIKRRDGMAALSLALIGPIYSFFSVSFVAPGHVQASPPTSLMSPCGRYVRAVCLSSRPSTAVPVLPFFSFSPIKKKQKKKKHG